MKAIVCVILWFVTCGIVGWGIGGYLLYADNLLSENLTLRTEIMLLRQARKPDLNQCTAWLFNSDLTEAKARICRK